MARQAPQICRQCANKVQQNGMLSALVGPFSFEEARLLSLCPSLVAIGQV